MDTDGSVEVFRLAELIAHEIRSDGKGKIRVVGWIGHSGFGGLEYAFEFGGILTPMEVGRDNVRRFPTDDQARVRVANRIRCKMLALLQELEGKQKN